MAKKNNAGTLSLPSDREIVMERIFNAPRKSLFRAYTDPNLIPRWWGPAGCTTLVDRMDVRPGGAWRFVQSGPGGKRYAFRGLYRGIVPPDWLAYTFEFEGTPGQVLLETVTFEESEGQTKVIANALFDSVDYRDGMLKSGMEQGAAESYDRLAELLQTMA
ncbi:MAG TPA: SRPBCC family protein [Candidatus Binatia bacterium]